MRRNACKRLAIGAQLIRDPSRIRELSAILAPQLLGAIPKPTKVKGKKNNFFHTSKIIMAQQINRNNLSAS